MLTVTQNIDALHEAAGTSNLIHMHGELERALCAACGTSVPWTEDLSIETLCARCGEAAMRPDVVWFGEMPREMERIYEALAACDLFISIGTSGTVYPAAGFVMEARAAGAHTVELNLEASDGAIVLRRADRRPCDGDRPGLCRPPALCLMIIQLVVIPATAGIQRAQRAKQELDPDFRRGDAG